MTTDQFLNALDDLVDRNADAMHEAMTHVDAVSDPTEVIKVALDTVAIERVREIVMGFARIEY